MARMTTRRPEEDEEDFIEDVEDEEEQVAAPAVSDSRRRRQLKRGEVPAAPVAEAVRKDRPTPSQRPEAERSSNPVVRVYQDVVEYFEETRSELGKVAWLNREELMRLTYIVLVVTAVSSAFLGLVGFLFGLLTQAMATGNNGTLAGIITIAVIVVTAGFWLFRENMFGGHLE